MGLTAIGAADAPFRPAVPVSELPPGTMARATFGDLDVLARPHDRGHRRDRRSLPAHVGAAVARVLEGCLVDCPLHNGQFDLRTGDATRMPTTGGLDADGTYHPVWTPEGRDPKPDPPGIKAEARRLTRVRRIRYYPVRIVGDVIEVAVPMA